MTTYYSKHRMTHKKAITILMVATLEIQHPLLYKAISDGSFFDGGACRMHSTNC